MRTYTPVLLALVTSACATQQLDSTTETHKGLTDQIEYESLNPKFDTDTARRIIEIANRWATQHCVLPSDLDVAVEVSDQSNSSLTLYISMPYEDIIGPEALLTLTYPGLRITKVETWHIDPKSCR